MSQENVEMARRYCETFNAGGLDGTQHLRHPQMEVHDPPNLPDADRYVGEAAVREIVESYLALGWDGQFRVEEHLDAGEEVVVIWQARFRTAHGGGFPVDQTFAHLYFFEGGKVRRIRQYMSRAEGLEAAGLRELGMSEENVDLVRRLFGFWNRTSGVGEEAADLAGEFFDPDVEWHDQPELPGATVHHVIEAVGRHLAAAQEALDYDRTDLLEVLDADPRVLAGYRIHARGRASGNFLGSVFGSLCDCARQKRRDHGEHAFSANHPALTT